MKKILPVVVAIVIAVILFIVFRSDHHEHEHAGHDHQHTQEEGHAHEPVVDHAAHHTEQRVTEAQTQQQNAPASGTAEKAQPFFPRGSSSDFEVEVFQLGTEITMQDAWVRATPPGATGTAAYMRLSNSGAADQIVVSASSEDFDEVSLHRTVNKDGLVSMDAMDNIVIPSGGSIVLKPSGMHVMLMDAQRDIQEGDSVDINLHLQNGKVFIITLPVRNSTAY